MEICNENFINMNDFESNLITSRTKNSITAKYKSILTGGGNATFKLFPIRYYASVTIKADDTQPRVEMRFFKNNVQVGNFQTFKENFSFDNSNGIYDAVRMTLSNGSYIGEVTFENLMLKMDDGQTDFIENEEQIYKFPLKEGQFFHKNDYLADNGIHQVKDDYIFTGDEVIIYYDVSDIFYTNILNNLKKGGLTNYTTNYFKTTENSDYLHLEDSSTVGQNKDGRIHFKAKEYKSADDFKALLKQWYESGKPLRIEYELAEEKIIPYTPEQKEAYNKIMQAIAYDDETNIICTDEIPCNLKVNAKMSKIKKLEQINAQIGA